MSQPAPSRPPARDLLKGKTAVITAAAGAGIGFAAASRFAEEGAELLISDIHPRRLGEAAEKLAAETGRKPATLLCDVSDNAQVEALEAEARRVLGDVDIVVNNAGLGTSNAIVEMTDEQWSRVIDVTLTSVFRMSRAFLPAMYARKSGVMVNNASVLGWRAQPLQAHYAAAKAGVMAFTRCAAIEAAEHGVRVNAVAPSIAMHEFLSRSADADFLAQLTAREAFGRAAEPWEVANVMLFLASDLSSYMTGEVVSVSSQRA
ncbi:SDR family oxidoreductase [Phenylobacterium sp.]|uniref:SDR family oxidoreductase n=1 Tax=Phenylobacterium sp. TaxID=1871053 RepID=UPI002F3EC673